MVAEAHGTEVFRAHCRRWLAENVPERPSFALPHGPLEIATREQLDHLMAWQQAAYEGGLVGCDYPEAYGGGGRTGCQRIANEEMARAGAPFLPNIVGLGMAGPAILTHGTEEQKRGLLPGILDGSALWCQGFSEPGAGSDLAGVRTRAVCDGHRWLVNGTKVWTSLAGFAGWIILLCRTDPADKYGGLTFFAAPIEGDDAVTVRPLIKMTGERGFFEVHLDQLVIEDRWRLGGVGEGWRVAMTTLLHERGGAGLVTPRSGGAAESVGTRAEELIDLAKTAVRAGAPAIEDPGVRDRLVELLIRQRAFDRTHELAGVPGLVDPPMRLALQHKLVDSELRQAIGALGVELLGPEALLAEGDVPGQGAWPNGFMGSFGYTIAAGTSEIQRNILGERVLGLAKSK